MVSKSTRARDIQSNYNSIHNRTQGVQVDLKRLMKPQLLKTQGQKPDLKWASYHLLELATIAVTSRLITSLVWLARVILTIEGSPPHPNLTLTKQAVSEETMQVCSQLSNRNKKQVSGWMQRIQEMKVTTLTITLSPDRYSRIPKLRKVPWSSNVSNGTKKLSKAL